MKIIAFIVFILSFVDYTCAQEISKDTYTSQFEFASTLYQREAYDSAIVVYNELLKSNFNSNELFFNIGNCYYKLNNIPYAIINYERFLRLNPNDDDAMANLKLANSRIPDKIDGDFGNSLSISNVIGNMFSLNTWTILCIVGSFLSAVFAFIYYSSNRPSTKRSMFFVAILLGFLTINFIIGGLLKRNNLSSNNFAIVTYTSTTVRSEPKTSSKELFVIHEGLKVKVVDELGGWVKISMTNGNDGWIQKKELIII